MDTLILKTREGEEITLDDFSFEASHAVKVCPQMTDVLSAYAELSQPGVLDVVKDDVVIGTLYSEGLNSFSTITNPDGSLTAHYYIDAELEKPDEVTEYKRATEAIFNGRYANERVQPLHDLLAAVGEIMPDSMAMLYPECYQEWRAGEDYVTGNRLYFGDGVYKVLVDHRSDVHNKPTDNFARYAKITEKDPTPWKKPTAITASYALGEVVPSGAKTYKSLKNFNMEKPAVSAKNWVEVSGEPKPEPETEKPEE